MRCIVHIQNSTASGRNKQYSLHILPLDSSEALQKTETAASEDGLCERLTELGLSVMHVVLTVHNLRDGRDATWTNVEIAPSALDGQDGRDERPPLAA